MHIRKNIGLSNIGAVSRGWRILFAVILLNLGVSANAFAGEQVVVPSDPKAKYTVLAMEKKKQKIVHITTQREGPSGRSFSQREIDCARYVFRYLGDGDTLDEIKASKPDPNFGSLVNGSISDVIASYACKKAGWR